MGFARPAASRVRNERLTLQRIVDAGVAIAVTEGLGAVSMARVAAEIGSSTMALYRYLPSKDDLLVLMVDTALGRPPDVFSAFVGGGDYGCGLREFVTPTVRTRGG